MEFQPSDDHYNLFGRIIYIYADTEVAIKLTLATCIDADVGTIMILTEPYSSLDLRNVSRALTKYRWNNAPMREEFIGIIGRFKTFGSIRNEVAHSFWTRGTRPGSIRSVRMNIRQGRPDAKGWGEDEPDYVIEDLIAKADGLAKLRNDLIDFHHRWGIFEAIERNIDALKSAHASEEGMT